LGSRKKENWRVVPNDVVVALARIELQRKSARILATYQGCLAHLQQWEKTDSMCQSFVSRLEHGSLRVGTEVFGNFEISKGPGSFRVRLTLGNSFPVEVGHLLDQVVIL